MSRRCTPAILHPPDGAAGSSARSGHRATGNPWVQMRVPRVVLTSCPPALSTKASGKSPGTWVSITRPLASSNIVLCHPSAHISVRDLKEVVLEEVAKTPVAGEKRGAHPRQFILETLGRARKSFALEGGNRSFTKAQVEELDEEDAKRALKAAEALEASVETLIEELSG